MEKNKIYGITIGILFLIAVILSFTSLTFIDSLRILYGSLFVLFLPGYVITELFLKRKDVIETIALSFALSIAIVPLAVFYLNKMGMRINTVNSILTILGIIGISLIIKHRRKLYKY